MQLIFTQHLKTRLEQRGIPMKLVKTVFNNSKEYYWDNLRNHHIKVTSVHYKNRLRKVLLAYDKITTEKVELITLHPITDKEIKQRLGSGRWEYEKPSG